MGFCPDLQTTGSFIPAHKHNVLRALSKGILPLHDTKTPLRTSMQCSSPKSPSHSENYLFFKHVGDLGTWNWFIFIFVFKSKKFRFEYSSDIFLMNIIKLTYYWCWWIKTWMENTVKKYIFLKCCQRKYFLVKRRGKNTSKSVP